MFNTNKIKKILILRFGAIGDVVHSTALFRSIKKIDQNISIHYLTFKTPALLLQHDPDLDKVWTAEDKSYKYLLKLAKELKKENFDLCINLHPSFRTKFLFFLLKPKNNLVYKKTFKIHAVENFWATAKPFFKNLILDDEITLHIPEAVKNKIKPLINTNKRVICLNTGANNKRQGRKWPLDHWITLTEKLLNRFDCEIVLSGSHEDVEDCEKITKIFPQVKSFCGNLDILENAALLLLCDLVISGDTGPLHIATAVKTPVIGLYGSMPVKRSGPYGKNSLALTSNLDCIPCNKRKCRLAGKGEFYSPCLSKLEPEKVFSQVERVLH